MGYIEVSRKRDSDPNVLSIRSNVSDANIERIYRAYSAIHFSNGVGPDRRPPTQAEVFKAAADSFVQIMISNTIAWEKSQQAANLPSPAPIEFT